MSAGSLADMRGAPTNVCFTPDSDHESGHVPIVVSALPPKADMCGATSDVCFGPIADKPGRGRHCVKAARQFGVPRDLRSDFLADSAVNRERPTATYEDDQEQDRPHHGKFGTATLHAETPT